MRDGCSDPADKRYRIELICDGVPASAGTDAATDIRKEFGHRPWHENVQCVWNGVALLLTAENDYDSDGRALMDEFSDAISTCIAQGFDGNIRVASVKEL